MAYYDFSRLIKKYSRDFILITPAQGYYSETGEWIAEKAAEQTMTGAIIGFKESRMLRSEGTLTAMDKRLFVQTPLPDALQGSFAVFDNKKYTISEETQNAGFTGFWSYTLKYVSAFGRMKQYVR